jgi:hypothetical protein
MPIANSYATIYQYRQNNPAAPERSQVVGERQSLSASGERGRYAALNRAVMPIAFWK